MNITMEKSHTSAHNYCLGACKYISIIIIGIIFGIVVINSVKKPPATKLIIQQINSGVITDINIDKTELYYKKMD